MYATSVRPLPLGANRLCAFCCSVGCIVTSIGLVRPGGRSMPLMAPALTEHRLKARAVPAIHDVVASPRKGCTHEDLWIGCGGTVRDFLRWGGQARTVPPVDVTAVIGSQLTYCVEVAAELLADIEDKLSALSTKLSGQGEKVPDGHGEGRGSATGRVPPGGTVATRGALLGPGDAELLHLPLQRRALHPQASRGPLRPAHHPARLAEDAEDVLPLGVGQRDRLGRGSGGRRPRAAGRRAGPGATGPGRG